MHLTKLNYLTPSGKPHKVATEEGEHWTDQGILEYRIANLQWWLGSIHAVRDHLMAQEKRAELSELLTKVKNG